MAPIAAPLQGHFDGGEISPLLYARVDSERYKSSLALCKNWIPTLQGGLHRRPGSYYVNTVFNADNKTRLIPFEYSTTQAYILEFSAPATGSGIIRFYADYGIIEVAGMPISVSVPYTAADLPLLRWTQNADVLYLVHPNYPPAQLNRLSNTSWQYEIIAFIDGPYLDVGASGNQTIVISGTGPYTLTASAPLFVSTDQGRLIRTQFTNSPTPVWFGFIIDTVVSSTVVTVLWEDGMGGAITPSGYAGDTALAWALGVWGTTTGWPGAVTFHEDRLVFSAAPAQPQRIDASVSSNYDVFSPTARDGTVSDSNALDFAFNANDVNVVSWLNTDEKGLLAGSVAAEWITRPSDTSAGLTPTNISAKRSTKWGSAPVNIATVGKSTLFVQRGGRKLRELMYYFDIDGYRATDLTELAEHITGSGVVDMTYQSIPISVVWLVRNDGALLAMTYDRDMAQLRTGWSWHFLGGQSDASGTPPVVESVATIPSPDGTRDDVWMVVKRWVNGAQVRYIEYLTKIFEDIDPQENAFFLDSGLTYNNPLEVLGATQANPCVMNVPSHGLTTGNQILVSGIKGMTELNGNWYTITVTDSNHFSITDNTNTPVNSTSFPAYVPSGLPQGTLDYGDIFSNGQIALLVQTISGLTYLEGEKVSILADGAVHPPQVVTSGGQITLEIPAAVVSVGYNYNSDGKLLRLEAGARNGTSLGKTRRIHRIGLMMHRSQGLQIGRSFTNLDPVEFRTQGADLNTRSTALFSGIESHPADFDYDLDNQICFRANSPLPCTILGIMPMLETQDRA